MFIILIRHRMFHLAKTSLLTKQQYECIRIIKGIRLDASDSIWILNFMRFLPASCCSLEFGASKQFIRRQIDYISQLVKWNVHLIRSSIFIFLAVLNENLCEYLVFEVYCRKWIFADFGVIFISLLFEHFACFLSSFPPKNVPIRPKCK